MESWVHRVGGEGSGTLPARMRQMGRRPLSVCPTWRLPGGRFAANGDACGGTTVEYLEEGKATPAALITGQGHVQTTRRGTWDLSRRCSRVRIQFRSSLDKGSHRTWLSRLDSVLGREWQRYLRAKTTQRSVWIQWIQWIRPSVDISGARWTEATRPRAEMTPHYGDLE